MVEYNKYKDKVVDGRDTYLSFITNNPKTVAIAGVVLLVLVVVFLVA